jgi:hypothetical protein
MEARESFARKAAHVQVVWGQLRMVTLNHVGVQQGGRIVCPEEGPLFVVDLATENMVYAALHLQCFQRKDWRVETRAVRADPNGLRGQCQATT